MRNSVSWPMRKKISRGAEYLGLMVVMGLIGILVVTVVLLSYAYGYGRGTANSYNDGIKAGRSNACALAVQWVQWSSAAEADMVKSRHYTQATGNEVVQNTKAGYAYVCGIVLVSPNIYDPNSKPVTVPLNKPTVPLGHRTPVSKIP